MIFFHSWKLKEKTAVLAGPSWHPSVAGEGLRVVIHTANMVPNDWAQKTQGVWTSPLLPPLDDQSSSAETTSSSSTINSESRNSFQHDLLDYLRAYKLSSLNSWIETVKSHDCSAVKVRLVGSVPGRFSGDSIQKWGHMRLRTLLDQVKSFILNSFSFFELIQRKSLLRVMNVVSTLI